jgi:hypothetical protein
MPHIEPFNSSDEEHDVEQREMLHIKMISWEKNLYYNEDKTYTLW